MGGMIYSPRVCARVRVRARVCGCTRTRACGISLHASHECHASQKEANQGIGFGGMPGGIRWITPTRITLHSRIGGRCHSIVKAERSALSYKTAHHLSALVNVVRSKRDVVMSSDIRSHKLRENQTKAPHPKLRVLPRSARTRVIQTPFRLQLHQSDRWLTGWTYGESSQSARTRGAARRKPHHLVELARRRLTGGEARRARRVKQVRYQAGNRLADRAGGQEGAELVSARRGIQLDNEIKKRVLAEKDRLLVPTAEVEPAWLGRVLAAAAFLSNAHSRLAGLLEAAPGIEGKREVLRIAFHQFLTPLGVNGERIQSEVKRLLASLPPEQAADFMRRIGADQSAPPAPPTM